MQRFLAYECETVRSNTHSDTCIKCQKSININHCFQLIDGNSHSISCIECIWKLDICVDNYYVVKLGSWKYTVYSMEILRSWVYKYNLIPESVLKPDKL